MSAPKKSAASALPCAHCGGAHGPAYPLAVDARLDGRRYSARTPLCLRCTSLATDDDTSHRGDRR